MVAIIERDTSNAFDPFRATVGTSAAAVTTAAWNCKRGVGLKAAAANSGTIYVGNADVTPGDTAATDGWPLAAGRRRRAFSATG